MLDQAYQSFMMFSWWDDVCVILAVIAAVYTIPLAWFIAFGEGVYTIRIGKFTILELESKEDDK